MSLLGIPDGKVKDGENLSWDTNKIGGEPDWMYKDCELGLCVDCGRRLKLVVQVYCPLANSPYHRTLYISTCPNKTCWNKAHCWKVQRCQILDPSSKMSKETSTSLKHSSLAGEDNHKGAAQSESVSMDTTTWCDDADDWGDADDNVAGTFGTSAENVETNGLKLERLTLVDVGDELSGCRGNNLPTSASDSSYHNNSNHGNNLISPETDKFISKDPFSQVIDPSANESSLDSNDGSGSKVGTSAEGSNAVTCMESNDGSVESSKVMTSVQGSKVVTSVESSKDMTSGRPFDCLYLSVVEEDVENSDGDDGCHVEDLLKKYLRDSGMDMKSLHKRSDNQDEGGVEEYEKTNIKGDKFSQKFYKRLKFCPQQCIRYCWNGQPMFISEPNLAGEITCSSCRGQCVFELQLMPPLINFLKNSDDERVEYGTVLVYTCQSNCTTSSCVTESIVLQPDPDHDLFR